MSLELMTPDLTTSAAFPGNRGFLVLAKLRGARNVSREALKRLRALTVEYCKERYPEELEKLEAGNTNGDAEGMDTSTNEPETEAAAENEDEVKTETEEKKEEKTDKPAEGNNYPNSVIKFGPQESMYDNCCFVTTNLADPSDYAHFMFCKMCDDPEWPRPRFPLRFMPVHEICCLSTKLIEHALEPLFKTVFGGDEAVRFSIVFHGKMNQDSKEMPRACIESIIRNMIWSINPNCVQCIKYQDYAVLLEVIDPMLFVGVARQFNQLGRYNTGSIQNGRDLKETMDDSEDEISDDPELSEADNIKKKLKIKKQRRAEKAAAGQESIMEEGDAEIATNGN